MEQQATRRRERVNPLTNQDDFKCVLAADQGMSTRFISEYSNLTKSQVTYTLKKFGMRLGDYRNGNSLSARVILQQGRQMVGYQLEAKIREKMARATDSPR